MFSITLGPFEQEDKSKEKFDPSKIDKKLGDIDGSDGDGSMSDDNDNLLKDDED